MLLIPGTGNRSLSAREIIFQRDQNTGEQLKFKDSILRDQQQHIHSKNHPHSSKSKARSTKPVNNTKLTTGGLVFIKSEGNKFKSRKPLHCLRDKRLYGNSTENNQWQVYVMKIPCTLSYAIYNYSEI